MQKPKILMIPPWYPTEKDPIAGSFFKEQALALTKYFDFFVMQNNISNISKKKILFHKYKTTISVNTATPLLPEIFVNAKFYFFNKQKQKQKFFKTIFLYLKNHCNFVPDLIYCLSAQSNVTFNSELAAFFKVPIVFSEHCPFPTKGNIINGETRIALSKADALLAISIDKMRQILIQDISCNPILIGNMIDDKKFYVKKKKNDIFTILTVAAYSFYKDYDTFFKTIVHLHTNTTEKFKVCIVGYNVTPGYSAGEEKFKAHIAQYNILDIITLIPAVSREKVIEYYHNSDVFVLTSIQEGLPVSALEAQCCGLPVFSTKCGGVEDFIDDSCGRIVNIRDYVALGNHLKDYIEGKTQFDRETIRENIINYFGVEAFTKRMYEIFIQVIENYNKLNWSS